jgi:hypothetical protein
VKRNADGSLTLYAGATSPGADRESNWLLAPDGHFCLYIRAYWGKQPIRWLVAAAGDSRHEVIRPELHTARRRPKCH